MAQSRRKVSVPHQAASPWGGPKPRLLEDKIPSSWKGSVHTWRRIRRIGQTNHFFAWLLSIQLAFNGELDGISNEEKNLFRDYLEEPQRKLLLTVRYPVKTIKLMPVLLVCLVVDSAEYLIGNIAWEHNFYGGGLTFWWLLVPFLLWGIVAFKFTQFTIKKLIRHIKWGKSYADEVKLFPYGNW